MSEIPPLTPGNTQPVLEWGYQPLPDPGKMTPDGFSRVRLWPKQEFFVRSFLSQQFQSMLFGGAEGVGKTFLEAFMLGQCGHNPDWGCVGETNLVMRNKFAQMKETVWLELRKMIPGDWLVSPASESLPIAKMQFKNGSRILGTHAQATDVISGLTIRHFVPDEQNEIDPRIKKLVRGRMRHIAGQSSFHCDFGSCNPDGGEVRSTFYEREGITIVPFDQCPDPEFQKLFSQTLHPGFEERGLGSYRYSFETVTEAEQEFDYGRLFVQAFPYDNGSIIDMAQWIAERSVIYDDALFEQRVWGNWDILLSLVYSAFNKELHVAPIDITQFKDHELYHVQALDWGPTNANTALLWTAQDKTGHLYVYHEEIFYQEHPEGVANVWKDKCREFKLNPSLTEPNRRAWAVADWGMKSDGRSDRRSTWEEFRYQGMPIVECQKRGYRGIPQLQRRFRDNTITIDPSCKVTIREHSSWKWKDATTRQAQGYGQMPSTPVDSDCDTCDALRYADTWGRNPKRPEPPLLLENPGDVMKSLMQQMEQEIARQNQQSMAGSGPSAGFLGV